MYIKGAVRWDVSAFPVVERSTNQTLWGFDFVPVRDADLEPEYPLDDLECEGTGDPHTALSANTAGYLMQQSSLGDVYAQLVTYVGQDKELSCEPSADSDPRSAPMTSPDAVASRVKKKEKKNRSSSDSSSSDSDSESESDKTAAPNPAVRPTVVVPKIPSDGAESSSDSDSSSGSSESNSESDSGAVGAAKSGAAVAAASKATESDSSSGSESESDSDPKVPAVVPAVAIASGVEEQESDDDSSGSSDEESILEPLPFLPAPLPFEPMSDHDSSDGSGSDSDSIGFKDTPTRSTQPSEIMSGRKRSAEEGRADSAPNIASKRPKINVQLGYVLCSVC
jgi:hypothetical protein